MRWASRGWRKVNCLLRRLGVKLSFALKETRGGERLGRNEKRRWDRVKVRYLGIV